MAALQQQDTLTIARGISPRRALPLRCQRRPLLLAVALVALTVVLIVLPNRMDDVLAERAAIAAAAEEQAERIEELARQLEAAEELSPEEREVLLRQLEALAKQLRDNRGDREQALADLSRVEEQMRQKLDPNVDARQAALEALAAQLQALAGEDAADKADPADMAETLQALAEQLAQMPTGERQAAAQVLAQMAARAAQAGDMSLAQALAAMAQAVQASDADSTQRAVDAARTAAEAMARAQADLDAQAALQRALAQVQVSRQVLAQAGQGQGQGQSGQGAGGQGTKARQLPPGTGTGQANRPQGQAPRTGVDDQGQQIYVPWERLQGQSDELVIPGQDSGQGETETRERRDPLPGASGQALVPYYQVYYQYLDAANQAMEQSAIPSGLKDYVRDYFSNLEP